MKIQNKLIIVCALLIAAGCSNREKQARYEQTTSAPTYGATSATSLQAQPTPSQTTPATTTTQPGAVTESENTLITQVRAELNKDATLAAIVPNIQITAQSGTVTLSGNVPSEQEKQKIEAAVKSSGKVVTVNNQLQVSAAPATPSGQSSQVTPSTAPNQPLSPTSERPESRIYPAPTLSQPSSPAPATQAADAFI